MLVILSNHCGDAIQNGIDIAANIMPSAIEIMIKSISQAINLSIQLANTISSVFVVALDAWGKVVCVFDKTFLLSNASTMTAPIRAIIPAVVSATPAIIA